MTTSHIRDLYLKATRGKRQAEQGNLWRSLAEAYAQQQTALHDFGEANAAPLRDELTQKEAIAAGLASVLGAAMGVRPQILRVALSEFKEGKRRRAKSVKEGDIARAHAKVLSADRASQQAAQVAKLKLDALDNDQRSEDARFEAVSRTQSAKEIQALKNSLTKELDASRRLSEASRLKAGQRDELVRLITSLARVQGPVTYDAVVSDLLKQLGIEAPLRPMPVAVPRELTNPLRGRVNKK